jgi:hypothetical protein
MSGRGLGMLTPRRRKHGTRNSMLELAVIRLASCWAAAAASYYALLHVGFEDAKGLFMSLDRHVKRLQHPLGGEVVDDDPLLHVNRLGRNAEWLGVQAEVENEFFGCAGNAAEICIERNRVLVGHFDTLHLLRLRSSLRLIAIFRAWLIGHDNSPYMK